MLLDGASVVKKQNIKFEDYLSKQSDALLWAAGNEKVFTHGLQPTDRVARVDSENTPDLPFLHLPDGDLGVFIARNNVNVRDTLKKLLDRCQSQNNILKGLHSVRKSLKLQLYNTIENISSDMLGSNVSVLPLLLGFCSKTFEKENEALKMMFSCNSSFVTRYVEAKEETPTEETTVDHKNVAH